MRLSRRLALRTMGRFVLILWPGLRLVVRATSDLVRGMSVTQLKVR